LDFRELRVYPIGSYSDLKKQRISLNAVVEFLDPHPHLWLDIQGDLSYLRRERQPFSY